MSEKQVTFRCPECDCEHTMDEYKDTSGEGYRVCLACKQEWWIDIDYSIPFSEDNQEG